MFNFKKYSFNEEARNFIVFAIYAIFIIFSIYQAVHTPSIEGKILYIGIMVVFMSICILSEYLRFLFRKAIKALNMECHPSKAIEYCDKVKKYDIFHSYATTIKLFYLLIYKDQGNPEACLQILEENQKLFKQNIDYLLIRNYNEFYCAFMLNQHGKLKKAYPEVIRMKGAKVKGAKVSPMYSWEEIEGVYYLGIKDYKKSRNAFKSVNTKFMNNRELSHFYYEYALLEIAMNNKKEAMEYLNKVVELSNQMILHDKAIQLLGELS